MTLEEAIKHCEEVAEELGMKADFETDNQTYAMSESERTELKECVKDHRQLAEWLKELEAVHNAQDVPDTNVGNITDLVSRRYLLSEYDRQHKGPAGGARKIIEDAPSVVLDKNVGDTISRQAAIDCFWTKERYFRDALDVIKDIRQLPSAQPEIVRCRDCKYFELNHVEKSDVFPIPIIVAHEICMKWGNGCQTSVDGWCFMAEKKTDE